jgi:hypothetical protein
MPATVVEMHLLVPGTYTLVDHVILRLNKGCVGSPRSIIPSNPLHGVGCKLHA